MTTRLTQILTWPALARLSEMGEHLRNPPQGNFQLAEYLQHNEQRTNRSDGDLRKSPDGR